MRGVCSGGVPVSANPSPVLGLFSQALLLRPPARDPLNQWALGGWPAAGCREAVALCWR